MKHRIDPKIDCVFKALLGAERNRRLLMHFLNAVLAGELAGPLAAVEILNPYNDREFLDDKLSIVDVKARDATGRLYQIEIQLLNVAELPARILYGWADLYSAQLRDGESYDRLRPTYAIWLLGQPLRADVAEGVHRFRLRDERGRSLLDCGGIWLLELSKCPVERVETEQDRWLKFFVEGHRLDDAHLPDWMRTEEMRQAMSTLKAFSEKERAYHRYQARQNYLRQQQSIQNHLEALQAEAERAQAEIERAQAEVERAQAEIARTQAEAEHARADAERAQADKERAQADKERAQAEVERAQADKERAQAEVERAQADAERARADKERERAEKEAALVKIERLKALLRN
ncbi:MAG: Rpn family recombination-promoting nuclease/putative transposase [Candidatus Contendobacter sp.]|nr:Rpn family recombination-promoting nuclease/putative transposase [Candidatus Contendobacter sp.]MDG4555976.1 Rpn family recombination-promoting nuclease/putative transposase [Candidatus Contendobacter sp.]